MFPQVMITMSMRPYIWMMTWATPLPSELLHHEGERYSETIILNRGN